MTIKKGFLVRIIFLYASYPLRVSIFFPGDLDVPQVLWRLMMNSALLGIFMFQHSVMALDWVKKLFFKLNLDDIERSIYNIASSGVLHLLIMNWQSIPEVAIWNFDSGKNCKLWFTIAALHSIAWYTVYAGCMMMDFSELAGLKQVYYRISGRPCPMEMKSRELRRYMKHMRHPSFTSFIIILWAHPIMR